MLDLPFRLYPRGYFGKVLGPQFVKKRTAVQARQGVLQSKVNVFQPQTTTLDGNPDVEELYTRWMTSIGEMAADFAFREQFMIVAMDAFGTQSFRMWYEAQLQSPAYGDLHHRFLEDTILFITEGRRQMSLQNWTVLISQTDSGEKHQVLGERALGFFGVPVPGQRHRLPQNAQLLPVLQQWISHPSGFEDLLLTLHLLFGEL